MSDLGSRLSLGTAQWGTPYGLTNERGELSDSEVTEIVQAALAAKITAADTHRTSDPRQGYGRAQARLRPWAGQFQITTKIYGRSEIPIGEQLALSLMDLGVPGVHACLVHDWAELTGDERRSTARFLEAARTDGHVTKVGVSAYDEAEVASAALYFDSLDVVQVPASVVDQRLVGSGVLAALGESGAEIQVRSIFLQGLLLEPRATAPLAAHPDIRAFHLFCEANAIDPLAACLSFINGINWANTVVIGVTGADELQQFTDIWGQEPITADWAQFASSDATLVDPRLWARP